MPNPKILPKNLPKILPAVFLVMPAIVLLTAQASSSEPAAEACRARPGPTTPHGGHWYYRFGRDKQQCWYLGAADARAAVRADASLPSMPTATPQRASAAAAPAIASPAMPTPFAPTAPAQVAFLEPSMAAAGGSMQFAARWPDDLPSAQALDQAEPATPSNSYADGRADPDAADQAPWPVIEAARAKDSSAADIALRYFSLAGSLTIPLLLLAGWAAKFTRRSVVEASLRDQWRVIAGRLRWPADFNASAPGDLAATEASRDPAWRSLTPTDPARDLKASLAELMRDLQRAGAASDSRPCPAPVGRTGEGAYRQALQAAE
jgi:hypothetical protein